MIALAVCRAECSDFVGWSKFFVKKGEKNLEDEKNLCNFATANGKRQAKNPAGKRKLKHASLAQLARARDL